ncbi:MAG: DivIVA domain-containing protein [Bacillota bacterium]
MNLSPLDIYNKEFKKSALGYNKEEVDDFIEEVGMAYEKLLKEINSLQDKNERLKEKLENYENIDQKLRDTLQTIQDTVTEEKERAKKEAKVIVNKAESEAEEIKSKAKKEVEEEYKKLEDLREKKSLFKIRFKTLLENHLELLKDKDENLNFDLEDLDEDIAATEGDTELD